MNFVPFARCHPLQLLAGITISVLLMLGVAAEEPTFPNLPNSPAELLDILKNSGERYAISGPSVDYVKESDIPHLVELLDSKEPCAFVDLSISSIYYPGRSTIGHEAAYLIEGFWKRQYPTGLTSQHHKPDIAEIKRWYQMWSHLKNLTDSPDTANEGKEYHLAQSQILDETSLQDVANNSVIYVLLTSDKRHYVFRRFLSDQLKEMIEQFPKGTTLHYDGNALLASPSENEIEEFKAFCQSKKINFMLGPTN